MDCPICTAALRRIRYEGVEINTCDGCGGEFVGPDQIAHIVNIRETRFTSENSAPAPRFGPPEPRDERTLSCPKCFNNMAPANYAADTGIFVDRCGACGGLWLEASELERIQETLEKWQDAAPARIRALGDELRQAQRRSDRLAGGQFGPSRFALVNAVLNRLIDAA